MARLAMEARSEFVRASPSRAAAMTLHFPIYRGGPYAAWQIDAAFALLKRLGGAGRPARLSADGRRKKRALIR